MLPLGSAVIWELVRLVSNTGKFGDTPFFSISATPDITGNVPSLAYGRIPITSRAGSRRSRRQSGRGQTFAFRGRAPR